MIDRTRAQRPPLEILERRPGSPTAEINERSMYAFLDSLTPEQRKQAVKRNPKIRVLMERLALGHVMPRRSVGQSLISPLHRPGSKPCSSEASGTDDHRAVYPLPARVGQPCLDRSLAVPGGVSPSANTGQATPPSTQRGDGPD